MAVVEWRRRLGSDDPPVMRNMMAPKRAAELKYWWVEARKVVESMPKFEEVVITKKDLEVDTILLEGTYRGVPWSLAIARKRHLK